MFYIIANAIAEDVPSGEEFFGKYDSFDGGFIEGTRVKLSNYIKAKSGKIEASFFNTYFGDIVTSSGTWGDLNQKRVLLNYDVFKDLVESELDYKVLQLRHLRSSSSLKVELNNYYIILKIRDDYNNIFNDLLGIYLALEDYMRG